VPEPLRRSPVPGVAFVAPDDAAPDDAAPEADRDEAHAED
jgi:hypothetical protein